jgi:hypothetical protein
MSTIAHRKRETLIAVAASLIWHDWGLDRRALNDIADELLRQAKFGRGRVPKPNLPRECADIESTA